jgi:hypothetical protein
MMIGTRMLAKSRYASSPVWLARLLIFAIVALVGAAALPHKTIVAARAGPNGYHDTALYRSMVINVSEGKGYYSTVGTEQRAHGYPTSPPQVFREPALAWFLAVLRTDAVRNACLFLFAAAIFIKFYKLLLRSDLRTGGRVTFIAAASTGIGFIAAKDAVYSHEVWAALFLSLSLLLYRDNHWWLSVMTAVVACLIRELALPFLIAMAVCASFERKWRELAGWIIGIAAFAVAFTLHLKSAAQLYRLGDPISDTWFALGGWPFALETARFNTLLHADPLPIIAFVVCCAIIGLAGARDARSQRAALIVSGYLMAFTIVGRPGNYYWGILYAPLLSIGFAYAPSALRDLSLRAFAPAHIAIR